jgi:DNA-binding MarR family transcriptional regulator
MPEKCKYEDDILRSLRRISRAIDLHSRKLASQYGLTGPQLVCLRILENQGPLTPSLLAKEISLSQGTITGIVDRLAAGGLVTRERSTKDRRSVTISISSSGQDMVNRAPFPLQESLTLNLRKLPPENQTVIHTVLQQIVRMMGAEEVDAAPVLSTGSPAVAASEVKEFLDQAPSNITVLPGAKDNQESEGREPTGSQEPGCDAS